MTDPSQSWSDERVELLRKLWSDGLSASQIAAELGGITRNAVIGKVHRLGLSGRAKSTASSAPRPRKPVRQPGVTAPAPAATTSGPMRTNAALAPQPVAEAAPVLVRLPQPREDVVIPMSERVTIMELRESMCRWPMGDPTTPEFRFCGARSELGMPYCSHHARIAYQPVADRRRDRKRA
ncbi:MULTISPECIES: GcrA family cell cycle regulator [unclassified Chelatococcus]|uniref:GcrA family cell cycle regulator n=1 Tax=unclassified Chelatococcus TaxID=2638111 RepID=UPI001BD09ED2|nr:MULTISPECIES: GcrA family cell cycle regulator [unclassified Chelatococcus]CAH1652938.1 GcrA cell cycle regulator [Hyphomicrobiales bacterium]MBS7740052.1 GcrA cell cycle regulator [Chelatococcus sp. HY11]MBX3545119.1 GcrA cell cycle regulator [Chelatococcus sp.]MCO5078647.1 GcrA cell cycle regulator [Chelatococcus sp.]CAH1685842.1 GcrA cell cycle regulator [Hyphomicrobiales bacterium]